MNPYDNIEKYINNQLSEVDRKAFDLALIEDSELRILVENYQEVSVAVHAMLEMEIKKEVEANTQEVTPTREIFNRKWWLVAAMFIFATLAVLFVFNNQATAKKESLMAFYERPASPIVLRSDTKSTNKLAEGINLFELNRYEESIQNLSELLRTDQSQAIFNDANWWLGHAYFNLEKYQLAITAFEKSNHPDRQCVLDLSKVFLGQIEESQLSESCNK